MDPNGAITVFFNGFHSAISATLGNLQNLNCIGTLAFSVALSLLAYIPIVTYRLFFVISLCVVFPVVILAVFIICVAVPNEYITPQQGLFGCMAGTVYAVIFYVGSMAITLIPVGIIAIIRVLLPFQRSEKVSKKLSIAFGIVLPITLALFGPFVSLVSSLLAIIIRIAVSRPKKMLLTYKRLMPGAAVIVMTLFSEIFLNGSIPVPEIKLLSINDIVSDPLGIASSAIAAIFLAIRNPRPVSDSIWYPIQCIILIAAAVCSIIFGFQKPFVSNTIALFALLFC